MDRGYTKLKLLYIKDYLEKNSDEDHPVSVEILTDMLAEKGITCERKSVYSDVKALKEYGMDIASVKKPFNGYAVLSRDFEVPEIRLLIDAVQAADFISPKKTRELIDKMGTLCSSFQSKSLQKQVYIDHRVKCANEEVYYNIDVVSRAIQQKKKISFIYYKRKLKDGEKVIVSDEKEFTVSPYALIWSNDHYYLVSNNEKYDNLMHTRIDRMKRVNIVSDKARDFSEVSEYKSCFDVADYSSKSFNMYSGDTQRLVISCDNSILEEIIDRFGSEGIRADKDESRFILSSRCVVSEGLASWIMQFGGKVKVLEPQKLCEDVAKKAQEIVAVYAEE